MEENLRRDGSSSSGLRSHPKCCTACNIAKVKCDRQGPPCIRCERSGRDCSFEARKRAGRPRKPQMKSAGRHQHIPKMLTPRSTAAPLSEIDPAATSLTATSSASTWADNDLDGLFNGLDCTEFVPPVGMSYNDFRFQHRLRAIAYCLLAAETQSTQSAGQDIPEIHSIDTSWHDIFVEEELGTYRAASTPPNSTNQQYWAATDANLHERQFLDSHAPSLTNDCTLPKTDQDECACYLELIKLLIYRTKIQRNQLIPLLDRYQGLEQFLIRARSIYMLCCTCSEDNLIKMITGRIADEVKEMYNKLMWDI